jgi:hypothetical protein
MIKLMAALLLAPSLVFAGADPDLYRSVPNGQAVYTGKDLTVGQTYHAFLIQFLDRDIVYLSPSRFRVSYVADGLQCRNAADFPMAQASRGQWYAVSFEVLAVKETAIESPVGSGNWVWQHAIDCTISSLSLAN